MENIEPICSLKSKLFFDSICSFRVYSRKRDIFQKLNLNLFKKAGLKEALDAVTTTIPSASNRAKWINQPVNDLSQTYLHLAAKAWIDILCHNFQNIENFNGT